MSGEDIRREGAKDAEKSGLDFWSKCVRVVSYLIIAAILVFDILSIDIVIKSLGPEKGANMHLMGLPVTGTFILILATFLLVLVCMRNEKLPRWEKWLFGGVLASSLAVWIPLFVLG